jgi:hypothetical protein
MFTSSWRRRGQRLPCIVFATSLKTEQEEGKGKEESKEASGFFSIFRAT